MTRLALAKTIVSGTITLQGNTFTFTASSSGTATGKTVTEAKASATAASNSAAITAARASIDKILVDNSAVLSDLEITSLISNNLSTTVKVFKPILLKSIATTTDGVNYTLKQNTIIGTNQWLAVPNGISLKTGTYPFVNNGYVQVGEPLQDTTIAQIEYSSDSTNTGAVEVLTTGSSTIDAGVTFTNSTENAYLLNNGTCNNYGTILNSAESTSVQNNGTFTNYDGSTIENSGTVLGGGGISSGIINNGTFKNSASSTIKNSGISSFIINNGICNNYGTILNSGYFTIVTNTVVQNNVDPNNGTFNNLAGSTIENSGGSSSISNAAKFYNYGTILNSGTNASINTFESFYNATITSSATIKNSGLQSSLVNSGGTFNNDAGSSITNNGANSTVYNTVYNDNVGIFNNDGAITNTGPYSSTYNFGTFNNDGAITNTGPYSSTSNSGTWNGTGTCGPAGTCQNT